MAEDFIKSENLSVNLLKDVFNAAYMDVSNGNNNTLIVKEKCNVIIEPDLQNKKRINLMALYGFSDSTSKIERLEAMNSINLDYVMIKGFATNNGAAVFSYDIMLDTPIEKKALVLSVKKFSHIVIEAINEYAGNLLD